jgi:hypothetical protein
MKERGKHNTLEEKDTALNAARATAAPQHKQKRRSDA